MSKVKYSDLFDFDGWFRELDRMETRSSEFSKNIVNTLSITTAAYKEQIKVVKELQDILKSTAGSRSSGGGGGSRGTSAIGSDMEKAIQQALKYKDIMDALKNTSAIYDKSISELRTGLGALKTQYDNLNPAAADFKEQQKLIATSARVVTEVIALQSTAMKSAMKSVNEVNGSYKQLNRQNNDLKNSLRSMPGAFDLTTGAINKHNQMAVQMQAQIIKNDAALKKMDATMGNHQRNVGNYSDILSGLTTKLNSLGLGFSDLIAPVVGFASAYEALSQSIQVVDQMSRLQLGLEAVSRSSDQVKQRWEFLGIIADKTGQDITSLTENYISFAAAAKNTKLEGSDGDKVFKSFSNTFAALGKSSDVANRGLYAIQQMISKTKVNSEELNQQLAEALPGANKLFADALGVSSAKLADMMKKGEVLSEEVLPKVAEALEKTYGDRAQKNISTISGSWTRLTNQVKLYIGELDSNSAISSFFSTMANGLADIIKGTRGAAVEMAELTEEINRVASTEKELPKLLARYDDLKSKAGTNKQAQKDLFDVIQSIDKILPGSATGFDQWGNAVDINKDKVQELIDKMKELLEVQKQTVRGDLITASSGKQARIDEIQNTLRKGTQSTRVDIGMGQSVKQDTPLSQAEIIKLRVEMGKLNGEAIEMRKNIFKIGGKEAFLSDIEGLRVLEGRARALQSEYDKAEKIQETFAQSQRKNNKASVLESISDDIKANDAKLKAARDTVAGLAKIYKSNKNTSANTNPGAKIEVMDAPITGDVEEKEKKTKKVLTQYEKLIAAATKLRGVLVDDLLADSKAGRAMEITPESLKSWNKMYAEIEKVSKAIGDDIPKNLRELNEMLNRTPIKVDAIQRGILPYETDMQPKTKAQVKERAAKTERNDTSKLVGRYSSETEANRKETSLLSSVMDSGSLKKLMDKDKDYLLKKLQEIQALKHAASIATTDDEKAASDARVKTAQEEYDTKMNLARAEVAGRKELMKQIGALAIESVNALFQIGSDQRAADMEANQMQMEHELSLVNGNAEAEKKIKEEYAKKDLVLRQKQAKMDKAQAAFSIGINTAQAVISALATSGPPWIGIAMAAIVGAMGAVQLATVLAKPLPQFWKGTSDAPEGPAHVAERGAEIRESKGKMTYYEKPSIVNLKKGDRIFTASQTKKLMEQSMWNEEMNSIEQRMLFSRRGQEQINRYSSTSVVQRSPEINYDRMTESFMKGFDSRPSRTVIYDEKGVRMREESKNRRITYLNDRYSLK